MRAFKLSAGLGACGLALAQFKAVQVHAAAPVAPHAQPVPVAQHFPIDETKAKLKQLHVVFRHGARTPLTKRQELWQRAAVEWDVCSTSLPTVPLRLTTANGGPVPHNPHNQKQVDHKLSGGCHMGQLTIQGQEQAHDLGKWLRSRYVQHLGFLPAAYEEGVVSARTTPFQRTIATLAGVLTGLLGGPDQATSPVHVITSSDLDEILYADTKQCPHLKIYMRMGEEASHHLVRSDPEYEWVMEELARLDLLPADVTGDQSSPAGSTDKRKKAHEWLFADMHDMVTSLNAAGKPALPGTTPRLVKALNRLATKEFAPLVAPSVNDAFGHSLLRLSMGVLLHTLVTRMEAAAARSPASDAPGRDSSAHPRIYLYSGHDSTIMPILSSLGIDTLSSWPPYLSNLVFELWEVPVDAAASSNSGSAGAEAGKQPPQVVHCVRVLYNRQELDVPHCPPGRYATLEAFQQEVVGPFLISGSDISAACRVPVDHDNSQPSLGSSDSDGSGEDDEVSLSAPSSGGAKKKASGEK